MSAIPSPPVRVTLDDLARQPGKAELIGGRLVRLPMTGETPNEVVGRIYRRLADHADLTKSGKAFTEGMGFTVPVLFSGRESFGPDAAYYVGPKRATPMRLIADAPTFAVEVRSENDYGPGPDREYEAKRRDYFEAGTLVVWDVDPIAKLIRSYRRTAPLSPIVFGPGDDAEAEPAVPGWSVAVDWVMDVS